MNRGIGYICKNYKEYLFIINYYIKKGYEPESNIDQNFKTHLKQHGYVILWIYLDSKEIRYSMYFENALNKRFEVKNIIRKIKLENINNE